MRQLDKQSSSHLWIRSVTTQMKRNLMMIITLSLRVYITKLIGNAIKMQCIGQNYPELKIKDCNSGKRSHFRSSPKILCQEIAFTE